MDVDDMENYINKVLLLWNKTKVSGFNIEEQVIASLLLGGLPEEYTAMILGIENGGHELTVDFVKNILRQEIPGPGREDDRAFPVLKSSNLKGTKDKKKNDKKKQEKPRKKRGCYACGDLLHMIGECPKNGGKGCFISGVIGHYAINCPNKNMALMVMSDTINKKTIDDIWHIDSGATIHMGYRRDVFCNFREEETYRAVISASGDKMQIKGVGDIDLKLVGLNGEIKMVQIKKVAYVPDICTNLMSVSMLFGQGGA